MMVMAVVSTARGEEVGADVVVEDEVHHQETEDGTDDVGKPVGEFVCAAIVQEQLGHFHEQAQHDGRSSDDELLVELAVVRQAVLHILVDVDHGSPKVHDDVNHLVGASKEFDFAHLKGVTGQRQVDDERCHDGRQCTSRNRT